MSEASAQDSNWSPSTPANLVGQAPAAKTHGGEAEADAARKRGFDEGFAEGKAQGLAAAQAQCRGKANGMRALLDAMGSPFRDSEAMLLRELLDLTERVSRAVIGRELRYGEDIHDVLKEALAALGTASAPMELTLHPGDAALCREFGLEEDDGLRIRESQSVERGGLTLRAGARFVDATVDARIESVLAALRAEAGVPVEDLKPERPGAGPEAPSDDSTGA